MSAFVHKESGPSSAGLREAHWREVANAHCKSNVALAEKKQVVERNAAAQKQKAACIPKQCAKIDDQKQRKAKRKREVDK